MKLTLDLPATTDELAAYAAACRTLGTGSIDAVDDALIGIVATFAPPTDLTPHIEQHQANTAAIASVTATQPPTQPPTKPKPTQKATSGTVGTIMLTAIADAPGGTWDGSYASLARDAYPTNPAVAQTAMRQIEAEGKVTVERVNGRVKRVTLTAAGYKAIGLNAPVARIVPTAVVPRPDPEPETPSVTAEDLAAAAGPIERRPFDPERARANVAL